MAETVVGELADLLWERVLARDPLTALRLGRQVERLRVAADRCAHLPPGPAGRLTDGAAGIGQYPGGAECYAGLRPGGYHHPDG